MNAIVTKHKLLFESAEWESLLAKTIIGTFFNREGWKIFRVGTVGGQWRSTQTAYEILSFFNEKPGNGHLNDVFEWFEYSCKRDKKDFIIREFWNDNFKQHCIKKRGFKLYNEDDLIKSHTK